MSLCSLLIISSSTFPGNKTRACLWQRFHPNALLLPRTIMESWRQEEAVPMSWGLKCPYRTDWTRYNPRLNRRWLRTYFPSSSTFFFFWCGLVFMVLYWTTENTVSTVLGHREERKRRNRATGRTCQRNRGNCPYSSVTTPAVVRRKKGALFSWVPGRKKQV